MTTKPYRIVLAALGWTLSSATLQAATVLLTNPGFEQFAADGKRPLDWRLGPGATVEKAGAAEGSYCLKLATTRTGCDTTAALRGIPTLPGKYYRLAYKVRGGEGSADTTGYQRFIVFASWDPVLKEGVPQQQIQQLSGRTFQDTLAAWQERTLEFFAPNVPSAGMVVNCWIEGPGTACFDDFRLTEVPPPTPPAFRLTLTRPYYRGTLFADAPVSEIQGAVALDSAAVAKLEIALGLADAKPVFSRVFKVKKGRVEFAIPARTLEAGDYRLHVRGLSPDGQCVAEETVSVLKVPAVPHTVRVREDNIFLADGQPFFPIGLWHIPATASGFDEKQLYELNRAGINTFLMDAEPQVLQKRLDQVAKYHLKPILNVWGLVLRRIQIQQKGTPAAAELKAWEDRAGTFIAAANNHPALFGYYFTDEPLWNGFPLQPVRAAYDYFRRTAPYRPIYINEAPRNTPEAVAGFAAASDFFGLDIYPVPEEKSNGHSDLDDKTLACVGKYTDRMRAAVNDRKPVVMTLQGFAWAHLSDKQAPGMYPTFEQSRFMAYDAIAHGAQGIMYWGTQTIREESFWQNLFRVTSELRDLSAVLTGAPGQAGQVTVKGEGIVFVHRVCGKENFIIAVNESRSEVKAVFQTRQRHTPLTVLFENRTMAVDHGAFTDVFAPQSVHVYASTGQLPPPLVPLTQAPDPGGEPAYLTDMKQRRALLK